jgi:hypothetical protein
MDRAFLNAESGECSTTRDTSPKRSTPDDETENDELSKPTIRKRAKLNELLQNSNGTTQGSSNNTNGAGTRSRRKSTRVNQDVNRQARRSPSHHSSDNHIEAGGLGSSFAHSPPFTARKTRSATQKQATIGERFVATDVCCWLTPTNVGI